MKYITIIQRIALDIFEPFTIAVNINELQLTEQWDPITKLFLECYYVLAYYYPSERI